MRRRNIGFFSDESAGYKYSGQMSASIPLSQAPIIKTLLDGVNVSLNTKFNGILVNQYTDGTKYIGAHSDDESALDKTSNRVASISFGSTRTFRVRDKATKQVVLDYPQASGTLLIMEGQFQKQFTHEVPIQKTVPGERISVTFRHHTS
jgi:alkylated DNA repair dioxygenase AlkB